MGEDIEKQEVQGNSKLQRCTSILHISFELRILEEIIRHDSSLILPFFYI